MKGLAVKAEHTRPAPGLLPPGGSRHQEKDSLEEELVDGQLRWDLELLPPPSLLPKPIPLPGWATSFWGGAEHQLQVPLNQGLQSVVPTSASPGSVLEIQVLCPHPRLGESENLVMGPHILCFNTSPPGDFFF